MLITTKAIVLTHFKYGDTSLICNCYAKNGGYLSFLVKGAFGKNKNRSVYRPLNFVEITYKQKNQHQSLHYFGSIHLHKPYVSLYENPIKTGMVFFLTDILNACLKNETQQNEDFFEELEKYLLLFDQKTDNYSEFHLFLLVQIIAHLGFSPDLSNADFPFFDLQNGNFCLLGQKNSQLLQNDEKELFAKLFQLDFSQISTHALAQMERKNGLNLMIRYLELHLTNFKKPISLEILKQL